MNFIHEYRNFFDRRLLESDETENTIEFWRNRLFSYLMMVIAPVSIIAYLPSMYMSIISETYAIGAVDTLAFLYIVFIIFNKSLKIKTKKLFFFIIMYLLSGVLLLYLGPYGPGLLFLLTLSIFYLLLVSSKAAFRSIVINFFFSLIPLLGLYLNTFVSQLDEGFSFSSIITFNMNFLLLNITSVVGISIIINGLNKKIENENNLTNRLKKQNRELSEAKEKAEQSDKLKSAFLANMSHEIRTPLNSITGFSSILASDDELDKNELKNYSEIINSNSKQLLAVISDIIEISKLQSSDIEIHKESFEIDTMIKEIYEANKYSKNEEITFDYIIDIDKKLNYVIGDVAKIKQILHNFVSNAFKYTQSGFIHLGVKFNDRKYYFFVKDTGIGIKEEIKDKIFENFFQTNDFYDGTGLGLSISKALSEIIKGEITVDSEIGVGTEFGLTLELDIDNSKTESSSESHFNNKIALIAEDQNDNYMLLNTVLKKLKIDTKRAINGLEVVEMARDEHFDIIFMDIKMPFMNGIEALKQIREFNQNITIFAVTAYAFDSDRDELLEAGFDEYISKPVNIDELRTKIKALI